MPAIILGFDFGHKNIGIAVGQQITRTANPLGIIKARGGIPDWQTLDRHIADWAPELLLVGLPLNMDSTRGDMVTAAEKFGRRLKGRYSIDVEMVDERLSTFEAKRLVPPGQKTDDIAATLILETWLSECSRASRQVPTPPAALAPNL